MSVEDRMDEVADAIKGVKAQADSLYSLSLQIMDALVAIQRKLWTIQRFDTSEDLVKVERRIERLHELKNMMELGSFKVQVNRAMDEAWRRLP